MTLLRGTTAESTLRWSFQQTWFTPDGDGWPSKAEAVAQYKVNHDGRAPAWVQREWSILFTRRPQGDAPLTRAR